MTNLDKMNAAYESAASELVKAAAGNDDENLQKAFIAFADQIQERVLAEAKAEIDSAVAENDSKILQSRKVRQLTSEEKNYYNALVSAMESKNPKQALANMDVVIPQTVVDAVFEELQSRHELLDFIDFQYGRGVTDFLFNANSTQLATWSPLCAEITKELTSGFRHIAIGQNKLSAFLPVCKSMLAIGPEWLDRYVRVVMVEALALGMEDGAINGKGQATDATPPIAEPIGMKKDLTSGSTSTGYADKEAIVVTSLDATTLGSLLAQLAVDSNGNPREVGEVALIVNPVDYFSKVMPATTIVAADGTYRNNVLPYPLRVIRSSRVASGKAILGVKGRYIMVAGIGKEGRIEYSDEAQFLEDNRVYIAKFLGHGQPKDNTSFLYLDISGLAPLAQRVYVTNTVDVQGDINATVTGGLEAEVSGEITTHAATESSPEQSPPEA